jgi:hypothetical protein
VMKTERLEIAAALLLALAAVSTAWSGYQSSRWHGRQADAFARASAMRVESTRASDVANRQIQIDVATFVQWVDAYAREDEFLSDFYRKRFRPEFGTAVDAWVATRPLRSPDAPLTPFAMPEYKLASAEEAEELETTASAAADVARVNIQRADNYTLCLVLFSAALFFAGFSTRFQSPRIRAVTLALGWLVFLSTLVWLATFPVSLAV